MKCKFCQAELEDDTSVCPVCGKDNDEDLTAEKEAAQQVCTEEVSCEALACEEAESAGAEPAEEDAENEEAAQAISADASEEAPRKKSPLKLTLMITGAVVAAALLVVLILYGTGVLGREPVMIKGPDGQMVEATLPADGEKGTVKEQGSYTVSDRKAASAADQVVATCGGVELTNNELQCLYWMQIYDFMKNYGSFAAAKGLDFTKPLDLQPCSLEEGLSWQQYFLKTALTSWHMYVTLNLEGEKAGHEVPADLMAYLDGLEDNLSKVAKENKFDSALAMLQHDMGAGSDLDGYRSYMELYYKGYSYYGEVVKTINPTDEEVEAYYKEHAEEFKAQGLKEEDILVDVRHCLIEPAAEEGAAKGEFTDKAWADAEQKAQKLLDEWKAGSQDEESFGTMADANTADPGSKGKGGLYPDVSKGQMVPEFDAWCFDTARKVGDTGIVKTQFGYHIMYFSGSKPVWKLQADQQLRGELLAEKLDALREVYPAEFDYSRMVLGFVDQSLPQK